MRTIETNGFPIEERLEYGRGLWVYLGAKDSPLFRGMRAGETLLLHAPDGREYEAVARHIVVYGRTSWYELLVEPSASRIVENEPPTTPS